ncbi:TetR/AcrR family transcriptional regulator [Xylophilus sp. GW821-FHT01B05]
MPLAPSTETHRTARGAARVRSLTDTAADMFLEQGYEAVSIDTLIARVGGSRRNIYSHFGGKEGLFIEVVTQLCTDLARPLEALEIQGEDLPSALTLFGRRLLQIVLQPRTLALHRMMVAEGQRFPALAQAILHAGQDHAMRIVARWVEQQQSGGQLRADLPATDLAAQFVSLVVAGPQLRALVGLAPKRQRPAQLTSTVDQAVSLFLGGALPTKAGKHA